MDTPALSIAPEATMTTLGRIRLASGVGCGPTALAAFDA